MSLDHLDKALRRAGLDPEGVRQLILAEAAEKGEVMLPGDANAEPSTDEDYKFCVRSAWEYVDRLLKSGYSANIVYSAVQAVSVYLESECAREVGEIINSE